MKVLLLVFTGGGLGSIFRYLTSKYINPLYVNFPLGTLTANLLSSLVLGLVVGYLGEKAFSGNAFYMFFVTGFCGGFSTFSTFSFETLELLHKNSILLVGMNIALNIVICITAVALGLKLGRVF